MAKKNDDDGFDEIVNSGGFYKREPKMDEEQPVSTACAAVEKHWSEIADGMFVKAFCITEFVDSEGNRDLHLSASSDMEEWDAIGMLKRALLEIEAGVNGRAFMSAMIDDDEDEEED